MLNRTYTLNRKLRVHLTQPVKIDLNKKLEPWQKTFQKFNIDAQMFRKTKNENPLTWEIRVIS